MAAYPLDKQIAGYNSLHDWLMNLAMDLGVLCDMWRWKFVATHLPPPSHPIGMLLVLAMPVKTI